MLRASGARYAALAIAAAALALVPLMAGSGAGARLLLAIAAGAIAAVYCGALAVYPPTLSIGADGITQRTLRNKSFRWGDVTRFGVFSVLGNDFVGIVLAPTRLRHGFRRAFNRDYSGGYDDWLIDTFGVSAVQLAALLNARLQATAGAPEPDARHDHRPRVTEAQRAAYEVLGVPVGGCEADVTAAYRRMAMQYHPDRVAHLAPEFRELAERRMKEINAAYAALSVDAMR